MTSLRSYASAATFVAALTAMSAILATSGGDDAPTRPAASVEASVLAPAKRGFRIHADHPTYGSVATLRGDATHVLVGRVTKVEAQDGVSPGVDAAGDPLPALARTNYTVVVKEVVKGNAAISSTIVVSLAGGTNQSGTFVVDGGLEMAAGDERLFYLVSGEGGLFYPLAGGAAIATPTASGGYTFSEEVTGEQTLVASRSEVLNERAPTPTITAQPTPGPSTPTPEASTTGAQGPATAAGSPAPMPTGQRVKLDLLPRQRLGKLRDKGFRVQVVCAEACRITGTLSVDGATAKSLKLNVKKKETVIATGGLAQAGKLILRLKPGVARRIETQKKVKVMMVVSASDPRGGTTTERRVVALSKLGAVVAKT